MVYGFIIEFSEPGTTLSSRERKDSLLEEVGEVKLIELVILLANR